MDKIQEFDVVVIGAGLHGIAFTRFYLEIHPTCRLVILEAEQSIGGTWCEGRSYDGFWAQCTPRMASFSDAEMSLPYGTPLCHSTFEAKHITKYLEAYVDDHVYDGLSLRDRVRLGHYVTEVEKYNGQWHILAEADPDGAEVIMASSKLVVATGRTSVPNIPPILNLEQYKGLFVHHRDFSNISKELAESEKHRHVVVVGGGKAASDMVYEVAKRGRTVSWIIRRSGEGPGVFTCAEAQGKHANSVEKAATRIQQTFSPSSFTPRSSWRGFIHTTSWGRKCTAQKVAELHRKSREVANYRQRPEATKGFENLNFEGNIWWMTAPMGLLQQDDFWDTIAQNVHVYRNDIDHMTSDAVILDDGTEIKADIVLCGTGWKPIYPFFSDELTAALGLPHDSKLDTTTESASWTSMLDEADTKVLRRFPALARPPPHLKPSSNVVRGSQISTTTTATTTTTTTTTRLYRCIAPLPPAGEENGLKARSVAILGQAEVSNTFRTAEAAAVWTTAWFDGNVTCPPLERARREVAYMNAFSRRRYPSRAGGAGDCFMWELVWYTDRLMQDVGLSSHRRRKGLLGRWTEPCVASDFKDILKEYQKKYKT